MAKRRALFVLNRAPCDGGGALEALDAALTAAAFDVPVSVLFLDDGVWQLVKDQATAGRSPARLLPSLELYDIATPPWVEAESLQERGLQPDDLLLPVALVERSSVALLMRDCDWLLNL